MADSHFKNTPPLVSVIIPTLNGEKFLKQTIDSVFKQTFQNFELIITDDVSNDGTQKVISQYQKDSRVSFFQNKTRLGIGGNWNYGIKQARGKYIKILCQDDILKPHYLDDVVEVLETSSSISLVTTFEQFFGESDKVRNERDIPFSNKVEGTEAQKSILTKGNWIGGPTAVTFRRAHLTMGMFDRSMNCGLDYEMWLRLLAKGNLYVVPKILFQSRIHKDQATTKCKINLEFDKDKIRTLYKIKKAPDIYGGIDSTVIEKVLDKSIRVLIDKSLSNSRNRMYSTFEFLNNYTGFVKTILFFGRGVVLYSVTRFRKAWENTES